MHFKPIITGISLVLASQLIHANQNESDCHHHNGHGCGQLKNMTAITACLSAANQKKDAELNGIWTRIMAAPQEKLTFDKQKLTQSQDLWMKFRALDCSKYNQGSIAPMLNAKCYFSTTSLRIHELKYLCKGLGDTPIC